MSTFCLDTSAIELITTGRHPLSPEMREWFDRNVTRCFISAISPFELAFGSLRLVVRASQNDHLRAHRIGVLNKYFLLKMSGRVIAIDESILAHAAGLRVMAEQCYGDIGACDAIIAATADLKGHTLVTLNVRQFSATGVRLVDAIELLKDQPPATPILRAKSVVLTAPRETTSIGRGHERLDQRSSGAERRSFGRGDSSSTKSLARNAATYRQ